MTKLTFKTKIFFNKRTYSYNLMSAMSLCWQPFSSSTKIGPAKSTMRLGLRSNCKQNSYLQIVGKLVN